MRDASPHINVSSHDRYLIYHMLGHKVTAEHFRNGVLDGFVEKVCRNIFDGHIEMTLSGRLHRLDEPSIIVEHSGNIFFVYGSLEEEPDDDELFDQMRSGTEHYGENIDDFLSRTRLSSLRVVEFDLGPLQHRRKTWRKGSRKPVSV